MDGVLSLPSSSQTLTSLNLTYNKIDAGGVKHLTDALTTNQV